MVRGFPGSAGVKNTPTNAGDTGLIPGLGRFPGKGNGNPLQFYCLENPHGQRSLAGYSSWGCKELNTTEWLHTHTHTQRKSVKLQGLHNFPKLLSDRGLSGPQAYCCYSFTWLYCPLHTNFRALGPLGIYVGVWNTDNSRNLLSHPEGQIIRK